MEKIKNSLKDLFRWFLSGLVILLPLGATLILLGWMLNFLDQLVGGQSVFARIWRGFFGWFQMSEATSLLLGYLFLLVVIVAVGYYARGFAKQQIASFLRDLFSRIPLINKIYHSFEQVIDLWSKKKEGQEMTHIGDVVIVNFMNTKVFGLLSSRKPYMLNGEEHFLVYLPSSPIPATGFNYFFKTSDVFMTELKFDEMTKIIVSLGVLGNDILGEEVKLKGVGKTS